MTRAIEVGQIITERQKGKPLEQVGAEFGVSGERIRQVLKEHYGTTKTALLIEAEVARELGVTHFLLARIRNRGIVKPQHFGVRYLYSEQDVEFLKRYIQERSVCPICDGPKRISSRACHPCWQRHRWLREQKEGGGALEEAMI